MLIALCSALHFKGSWTIPFESPFEGDFHLNNEKTVKTQLMSKKDKYAFTYDADLSVQVVELPYTNDTQMVLVVPQYHDGLGEVEKKLTDAKLRSMMTSLDRSKEEEVEVIMPKFTLETTTNLRDSLEKLGVTKMFDSAGFITEMSYQPLSIGAAVHKGAYIHVYESYNMIYDILYTMYYTIYKTG